ncbi:MAG: UvrD-helicase domain-containing protein [Endomicrobium sp.]|nr:UvrD-helicase domain-containing protein [Endomicrobium sp.]
MNLLDFNDLMIKTIEVLRNFPNILQLYQRKFNYIMVDKYQDTNFVRYLLIKTLSEKHKNICVVGDDDQTIYNALA